MNTTDDGEIIVTIDGPAGSGKSSAARALATRLGFDFLDTGAMYRCVGLACLSQSIEPSETERMVEVADATEITFSDSRVLTNGKDVTEEIRSEPATRMASIVAVVERVRDVLVRKQREWARGRKLVSEGRDQGTVVFPGARCKFFLTASAEVRARRRHDELASNGQPIEFEELLRQIRERDERDEQREVAPLKPAPDAEIIDTSEMDADEVLLYLETKVRAAEFRQTQES